MLKFTTVKSFVLVFLLTSFPFFSAFGANKTIMQSETAFSIGTGLTHLSYGETVSRLPGYLDTEDGNLSTTTLEYSYLGDDDVFRLRILNFRIPPSLYFKARLTYATGKTAYVGYLNTSGNVLIPVTLTDQSDVFKTDFAIGSGFYISSRFILIPNLQIGTHYWARTVGPNIAENTEDYRHNYFGIGLKTVYASSERVALSLDADFHRTFNAHMTSSLTGDTYTLGDDYSYVVTGKITYEVKKDVNFFARVSFESFKYGASPVQADATYEPDSKTQMVQYTIGLAYAY